MVPTATTREIAVAEANEIRLEQTLYVGAPAHELEQFVVRIVLAHEAIARERDGGDDQELEELLACLQMAHQYVYDANPGVLINPLPVSGTFFGVPDISCNGYSTYIARSRAAYDSMVEYARSHGYNLFPIEPSAGSGLDLYAGSRGGHRVMLYGPVAEQPSA